ncbi:MAG: STAS domain-containing protein [Spirochaetia bacterium]|nr:STAS domain-containing protein [Spirochaetia bacterium]
MSVQINIAQDKGYLLIKIAGDMTIYHSIELKEKIFENIKNNNNIVIDLSGVLDMDTAGFQLLVLARKEAEREDKKLKIIGHSSAALKLFDLYGAVGFFGDKIKIPQEERENYSFAYGIKKQKVPV